MVEVTFPARMLHVGSIATKNFLSRLQDVYVESNKDSVSVFGTDGKSLIISEKKQSGAAIKASIPIKIASLAIRMAVNTSRASMPEVTLIVEEKVCRLSFHTPYIGRMSLEWERDVSTHPPYRDVIPKGNEEPIPTIGFSHEALSKSLAVIKKLCDEGNFRVSFFGKNKAVLIEGRGGPFDTRAVVMPFTLD